MNIANIATAAGGAAQTVKALPPAAAPAAASATTTAAAPAIADTVSFSPLASSLRDESLTAFNALSSDLQSQISALVESGQISGEDMHQALKHRMKEARSHAYAGTFRMSANSHPEVSSAYGSSRDDYRAVLTATSERRAGLMAQLTGLEKAGQAGSADYAAISSTLTAYERNPRLAHRSGMNPYGGFDFDESRLMHTEAEMKAAYTLKGSGIDLSAIDRALRPRGEQDAASIIAEKLGLSKGAGVAVDREFTRDNAYIKGFPQELFDRKPVPAETSNGPGQLLQEVAYVDGAFQATGRTVWKPSIPTRRIDLGPLPEIDPTEQEARRRYFKDIRARY